MAKTGYQLKFALVKGFNEKVPINDRDFNDILLYEKRRITSSLQLSLQLF